MLEKLSELFYSIVTLTLAFVLYVLIIIPVILAVGYSALRGLIDYLTGHRL